MTGALPILAFQEVPTDLDAMENHIICGYEVEMLHGWKRRAGLPAKARGTVQGIQLWGSETMKGFDNEKVD